MNFEDLDKVYLKDKLRENLNFINKPAAQELIKYFYFGPKEELLRQRNSNMKRIKEIYKKTYERYREVKLRRICLIY